MIPILRQVPLTLASLGLLGQELPRPAHPEVPPFVTSRCGPGDVGSRLGALGKGLGDSGMSAAGTAHFIQEGELWLVRRNPQGHSLVRPRGLPGGALEPFTQVRYRNGVLFKGTDRALLQATEGGAWTPLLGWKASVAGIEVDEEGRPMLLGTPTHLLEVYEPGGQKPVHVEPYPESEGTPGDRALFLHAFGNSAVTCQVETWRVLYFPEVGRLFAFDAVKRKLREIRTPWHPLEAKGLEAGAARAGAIVLDGIPSSSCLQLVPLADGTLGVGYQVIRQTASLTQDPVKGLILDRKQDRAGEFVHWFEVDLAQGTAGEVREYPEFQLPVWKDPLHGVVALQPWRDAFSRGVTPPKPAAGK